MTEDKKNKNGIVEWLKLGAIGILVLFGFAIFSNVFDFVQNVISALIGPLIMLFLIGSGIMYLMGDGNK